MRSSNRKINIVAFLLASIVLLPAIIYAQNVDVGLPTKNGNDAFRVLDSGAKSLMNVQSDGKVGIGETSPGAKLHVGGTAGVDGIMFPDNTLQTTATLVGPKGDQGVQGKKGVKGDQGVQGKIGPEGPQGKQGVKGDTGLQGPQGKKGVKGDTGLQGPQGKKGVKGDTGLQGPQGKKGVKGDTGLQGPQGKKGIKGDTGLQGPQGKKGVKGDTGLQGPQGKKGDKGDKGDSSWTSSLPNIYNNNSGNVGVGTVSPNSRLHVNGSSTLNPLRVQVSGSSKFIVDKNGGAAVGYFVTPPANGLYVDGNTGLGTSSPGFKLDVRSGTGRTIIANTSGGAGAVQTFGSNGNSNTLLSNLSGNGNNGFVSVQDSSGTTQAGVYVNSAGNGIVFGDTKSFIVEHPTKPDSKIMYICMEGPEAAIYNRGVIDLVNGSATISLPEHFSVLANLDTATVNLTPHSLDSRGVAVASINATTIKIGELFQGTGSYKVSFLVQAVRKGYEDHQPVISAQELNSVLGIGAQPDQASSDSASQDQNENIPDDEIKQ